MEWISEDEYIELTGLDVSSLDELVDRGKLNAKVENGVRYIDPTKVTKEIVPLQLKELAGAKEVAIEPMFVEKTIGTIINLHEKVLDAKDETIRAVKVENEFLREALASLQELYDEDRKTIHTLQEQLKLSQQEVEFMRRKYKLMWNKTIEEHVK
ncbi:MAG: DUF3972 domain-containing protein [Sulfurimonadaceae bacterium]|jgi:hypothetical protein|nr:DUF3972 domain-containing protein [Sulfurimonadaceae bacterium]